LTPKFDFEHLSRKKHSMYLKVSAALVFIPVLGGNATQAAEHGQTVDKTIIARQLDMKSMAEAAKLIDSMFKSDTSYDSRLFKAAAETILKRSGNALVAHFEGNPVIVGSNVSSTILTERAAFAALANDLTVYANSLASAAENHPDALSADMRMKAGDAISLSPFRKKADAAKAVSSITAEHAFHSMLQTCTSCHAKFRLKTR